MEAIQSEYILFKFERLPTKRAPSLQQTDPKHSPLRLRGALPDGPDHHAQSAPSAPSAALVLVDGVIPVNPLLAVPLRTGALFRLAEMNLSKKEGGGKKRVRFCPLLFRERGAEGR